MTEFSRIKIIHHCLHDDNDRGESRIFYGMIIFRDLMVQLGLTANYKWQVIQWDGAAVHIKELSGLLGQSVQTKHEMRKVVMQNSGPASKQEATERMVKSSIVPMRGRNLSR